MRSTILETKSDRCKIVKILIKCSHSWEHFQSKNVERVLGKENEILVFSTILHLPFLISNMMLLILLFAINLLARINVFKEICCITKGKRKNAYESMRK